MVGALSTLLLLAAAEPRVLLFGEGSSWLFMDERGHVLERVSSFGGLEPIEAGIAPNGLDVAFTSWNADAQNKLLYLWRRGERAPRRIGSEVGYHAQPRFSRDGRWLTFGHNRRKGGPPGQHEAGANAQLFRARADGSRMEMLTSSPGCKRSPVSLDGFSFVYVHASCDINNALAMITAGGRQVWLTELEAAYDELDLSPDGSRLITTLPEMSSVTLIEVNVSTRQRSRFASAPRDGQALRPTWSADGAAVLYQALGAVWRVDRRGTSQLASFSEAL